MPYNAGFSAQFFDKEVLKYPAGLEALKNVVFDATKVTLNTDRNQRTVVPAGTILCHTVAAPNKVWEYTAQTGELIVGILSRPAEFFDNTSKSDLPCAAFFWNCIFDKTKIVNQSTYAAALATALPSCDFQ